MMKNSEKYRRSSGREKQWEGENMRLTKKFHQFCAA